MHNAEITSDDIEPRAIYPELLFASEERLLGEFPLAEKLGPKPARRSPYELQF